MIHTVGLMSSLWTLNCSIRKWVLQQPFEIFRQKHKSILQQITTVSCMDNLLCGEYNSELVINDVAKDAKKNENGVCNWTLKMQDKISAILYT